MTTAVCLNRWLHTWCVRVGRLMCGACACICARFENNLHFNGRQQKQSKVLQRVVVFLKSIQTAPSTVELLHQIEMDMYEHSRYGCIISYLVIASHSHMRHIHCVSLYAG